MSKIVEFDAIPIKKIYEANEFKMYGCELDKETFPHIKLNKFSNVCIKGALQELAEGQQYHIKAEELYDNQYGYSYRVLQIRADKPHTSKEMYNFLKEILTPDQALTLWKEVPDIVDRVKEGRIKDIDLSKLPGIGEYRIKQICEKIEKNYCYADIISEFHGVFSYNTIIKLSQKYPSVEKIREELNKNPYKFLTSIDRVGFKKADTLLLKMEKEGTVKPDKSLKESKQRCMAFILFTLKQNEADGNTKMSLKTLQELCKKEVEDCALHFVECIKSGIIHVDKEEASVGLQSAYNTEKYLAERLIDGLKCQNVYDIDISGYKKVDDDIELTDEQMQGIENLCKYSISILDGPGGSGKTQVTTQIVKMLKDNKKSFLLLSPTGRAAKVLSEYANYSAYTIHRGLGYNPKEGWLFCKDNPLYHDVVIVDEFSMVDVFLFKHLLDAIDFTRTKLMMIGDSAQLNSVQAGNCLHDMMDSEVIPTTTLTRIFRYGEGGLMTVATDTRMCKPFLNPNEISGKATSFGQNKDYIFIKSRNETVIKDTLALYQKVLSLDYNPEDVLVLSSYNKGDYGTVVLNNKLQIIANPICASKTEQGFTTGKRVYYRNDLILQTVNDYKVKKYDIKKDEVTKDECMVCNGEIGKVYKVLKYGVVIKFDDNYTFYNGKSLLNTQLGYAVSIHRSQGGSAKVVILVTPDAHQYMLNSNLLYVGLTRMKEKCYQLGNIPTINKAVLKKENLQRKTYLRKLLTEMYKL